MSTFSNALAHIQINEIKQCARLLFFIFTSFCCRFFTAASFTHGNTVIISRRPCHDHHHRPQNDIALNDDSLNSSRTRTEQRTEMSETNANRFGKIMQNNSSEGFSEIIQCDVLKPSDCSVMPLRHNGFNHGTFSQPLTLPFAFNFFFCLSQSESRLNGRKRPEGCCYFSSLFPLSSLCICVCAIFFIRSFVAFGLKWSLMHKKESGSNTRTSISWKLASGSWKIEIDENENCVLKEWQWQRRLRWRWFNATAVDVAERVDQQCTKCTDDSSCCSCSGIFTRLFSSRLRLFSSFDFVFRFFLSPPGHHMLRSVISNAHFIFTRIEWPTMGSTNAVKMLECTIDAILLQLRFSFISSCLFERHSACALRRVFFLSHSMMVFVCVVVVLLLFFCHFFFFYSIIRCCHSRSFGTLGDKFHLNLVAFQMSEWLSFPWDTNRFAICQKVKE